MWDCSGATLVDSAPSLGRLDCVPTARALTVTDMEGVEYRVECLLVYCCGRRATVSRSYRCSAPWTVALSRCCRAKQIFADCEIAVAAADSAREPVNMGNLLFVGFCKHSAIQRHFA